MAFRRNSYIAIVVGLGLFLPMGGALADREPAEVISVSGVGEVTVKPDVAEIRTGVVSQERSAEAALRANSAAIARVIDGLAERGIVAPDVATQSFSVAPLYGARNPGSTEAPPIVGFQVSNQVLVRLRDVTQAGAILDILVRLGANQVGSVSFRVDDSAGPLDEARKLAVGDAQRKAALLAKAAGVKLGRVLSIQEGGGGAPQPLARSFAFAEATSIEPGEQVLSARVTVVFRLDE